MEISRELQAAMAAAEKAVIEAGRTDHVYGARNGSGLIAPWPTAPCKLVFLDFDGVLNSDKSVQELGTRYRFAKSSVDALNEIVRHTDARIVISSTWRNHWTLIENASYLKRDGVLPNRVVGKTKALDKERGLEIDLWLQSAPYPVESFVILDDRDDMLKHCDRLVKTDPQIGLTMSHARQAIEILASPWRR
jgi:hypothetical protein